MPSNGGEFSGWLDRSAHIARGSAASVKMSKNVEIIIKEARKKPRMRTYTTYDDINSARLGWLAPARQL